MGGWASYSPQLWVDNFILITFKKMSPRKCVHNYCLKDYFCIYIYFACLFGCLLSAENEPSKQTPTLFLLNKFICSVLGDFEQINFKEIVEIKSISRSKNEMKILFQDFNLLLLVFSIFFLRKWHCLQFFFFNSHEIYCSKSKKSNP